MFWVVDFDEIVQNEFDFCTGSLDYWTCVFLEIEMIAY